MKVNKKSFIYIGIVLIVIFFGYSVYTNENNNQTLVQECKDRGMYPEYERGFLTFSSSVSCLDRLSK
ncbi:hypothetical protein [Cytobacillus sp. IB215665]|uniref:hypothetical protein n=1 Tax=Cytobacillus sp. IB215665 TaxID=3097357 RepID=UPI002A13F14B|nr:hypothetical protein [Cytobacillus sp. IB215665]MDX8367339.1 hypothetical protein [Cytobacillus sp. IB215665]